jgi:hypothetical protein
VSVLVAGEQTVVWVHSPRRETVVAIDAVLVDAALPLDTVLVDSRPRSTSWIVLTVRSRRATEGTRTDTHGRVNRPA